MPHLPLSPIDALNQPSEFYLWVQDGLTLFVGVLWAAAYVLYIRQSSRDQTYGMPIVALCGNIGWELVYGFIHPPAMAEYVAFMPYFLIDMGLLYGVITYGAREFKGSPLVQKYLPHLIITGCVLMVAGHWTMAEVFFDKQQGGYWGGYICQNIISWASIAQLLRRGHTKGHSLSIWALRFVGTTFATAVFQWRVINYPVSYGYVATPLANFLFISPFIFDLLYLYVFYQVRGMEKQGGKNKVQ